jgi:hypothetical protein
LIASLSGPVSGASDHRDHHLIYRDRRRSIRSV